MTPQNDNTVLQRRLVLLATLAVVVASFRHLTFSYCSLEPQATQGMSLFSATCSTALFTAVAIDVSVIVLVRLALRGREVGGRIGAIVVALTLVTVLSVLGNLSAGLSTTVAHDGGGTGVLFTMADLSQLDSLSIGRVGVFFGLLPVLILFLTLAGARAAQNERESVSLNLRATDTARALSRMVGSDVGRHVVDGFDMLPQKTELKIEASDAPARRRRLPSENPERMAVRGKMGREEAREMARRIVAEGGGTVEIFQAIGGSMSTAHRLRREAQAALSSNQNDNQPDGRML